MRHQTINGPRQQIFQMTTGVLQLMKGRFDAFSNTFEQLVEGMWVLLSLVDRFGRPQAISGLGMSLPFPPATNEAFVDKIDIKNQCSCTVSQPRVELRISLNESIIEPTS